MHADCRNLLHVSSDWDAARFREYVIDRARKARVASDQNSLSKLTGIDTGLLGRYFRGETQPGPANLRKIQAKVPGTTMQELLVLAGRAASSEFEAPRINHPRAVEVERLLGEKSPLPQEEQDLLDEMLQRVLAKYENVRRIA